MGDCGIAGGSTAISESAEKHETVKRAEGKTLSRNFISSP
jgi:hypothetical protein